MQWELSPNKVDGRSAFVQILGHGAKIRSGGAGTERDASDIPGFLGTHFVRVCANRDSGDESVNECPHPASAGPQTSQHRSDRGG